MAGICVDEEVSILIYATNRQDVKQAHIILSNSPATKRLPTGANFMIKTTRVPLDMHWRFSGTAEDSGDAINTLFRHASHAELITTYRLKAQFTRADEGGGTREVDTPAVRAGGLGAAAVDAAIPRSPNDQGEVLPS